MKQKYAVFREDNRGIKIGPNCTPHNEAHFMVDYQLKLGMVEKKNA